MFGLNSSIFWSFFNSFLIFIFSNRTLSKDLADISLAETGEE